LANALTTDIMTEKITRDHPEWLGEINPYNDLIDEMFPYMPPATIGATVAEETEIFM
jgi:hypothetical protein